MLTTRGKFNPADGLTDLGDGVKVPSRITVTVSGDLDATLEVVARGGRLVCQSVTIRSGDGVTTDMLRMVPVAGLVRDGVMSSRHILDPQALTQSADEITRDGPTDDALRAAAAIYRLAYALGDPPTKAVALRLGMGYSTAARWVTRARERGFLSGTTPGKAGI